MEGAPEHTRDPIFFYVQSLRNGDTSNMSMDSRCTVHDLCVELSKKNGVDPNRMSIIIQGKVADRDMTLEFTNLHKHETVRVLVRDGALHDRSDDEDDDSPSDAMSLCHGRPMQDKEVPSITIHVEFMAPYMDTQMTCVVNGDKCNCVGDIHRYVSRMTAIITERMFFYKNGVPLDPTMSLREAGFDKVTRLVMRTLPKPEWPAKEAGSPSREVFTPDYSNSDADE